MKLEKGRNLDYWNDITVIVEDELYKLRKMEKKSEYEAGDLKKLSLFSKRM